MRFKRRIVLPRRRAEVNWEGWVGVGLGQEEARLGGVLVER